MLELTGPGWPLNPPWPLYPFKSDARPYDESRGSIAGIKCPGGVVSQYAYDREEPEEYYFPLLSEVSVVEAHFPEEFASAPPWHRIQAKVLESGFRGDFSALSASAVIELVNATPIKIPAEWSETAASRSDSENPRDSYHPVQHYERDVWIYEQRSDPSKTWNAIFVEMEQKYLDKWDLVTDAEHARRIVKKIAAHHGWKVPKGKPGRPKKSR